MTYFAISTNLIKLKQQITLKFDLCYFYFIFTYSENQKHNIQLIINEKEYYEKKTKGFLQKKQ